MNFSFSSFFSFSRFFFFLLISFLLVLDYTTSFSSQIAIPLLVFVAAFCGLVTSLTFLCDLLSILFLEVKILQQIVSLLYSAQISVLLSLMRLFIGTNETQKEKYIFLNHNFSFLGKKKNVLRNRIDHQDFDLEQ